MERVLLLTLAVLAFAATCTALPDPKYALNQCEDPVNLFDCGNGQCIRRVYVCDLTRDCSNGADESFCRPEWQYHHNQYHCYKDDKQIPRWKACDKKKDCSDGKDEKVCGGCFRPHQYQCKNPHYCKSIKDVCNGKKDCPDGDDEENCPKLTYSPPGTRLNQCADKNNTWDCGQGQCVTAEQICNAKGRCSNFADSAGCPSHKQCNHENQFKCKSGKCIPNYHHCDGINDCGSDEKGCPKNCTSPNQVRCEGVPLKKDRGCVDRDLFCNGSFDCPGGEDEEPLRHCPKLTYPMDSSVIG